jgi:hypothetical protein
VKESHRDPEQQHVERHPRERLPTISERPAGKKRSAATQNDSDDEERRVRFLYDQAHPRNPYLTDI